MKTITNHLETNISNQDVDCVVRAITDTIRLSQDLFDSSTPAGSSNNRLKATGSGSSGTKKKKQKTSTARQPRPAKQSIFTNDLSGPNSNNNCRILNKTRLMDKTKSWK